jgi:hypothetical protein
VLRVLKVIRASKASKVIKVPGASKAPRDSKDSKVTKVTKVLWVLRAPKVRRVLKVPRVQEASKDSKDSKVLKAPRVTKVLKASRVALYSLIATTLMPMHPYHKQLAPHQTFQQQLSLIPLEPVVLVLTSQVVKLPYNNNQSSRLYGVYQPMVAMVQPELREHISKSIEVV